MATAATSGLSSIAAGGRDNRIDMFRGLSLVIIFIDHLQGSLYLRYTPPNWGFSTAAEWFVLIAGISCGLAYSRPYAEGRWRDGALKLLRRIRTIYLSYLLLVVLSLAIMSLSLLWLGDGQADRFWRFRDFLDAPLEFALGIPLLVSTTMYANILPLYIALLGMALLAVPLAVRRPWLAFALSLAVWVLAGQLHINLPRYRVPAGWLWNPFSWQLLFFFGLAAGIALKQGRRLVGWNLPLFLGCLAYLLVAAAFELDPTRKQIGTILYLDLRAMGFPDYIVGFDRTYLGLPKIMHTLSLAYVVGQVPAVARFAGSRFAAPLNLLGRQSLQAFLATVVLDITFNTIRFARGVDPLTDGLMIVLAVLVMLIVADIVERWRSRRRNLTAVVVPA